MHSFVVQPITDCCTTWSGPYHTLRHTRTLCSFYLSFVFKTFVSTLKKKEVFPWELRLKFISSHRFASLHLRTFAPSLYLILPTSFALLHHFEPPSRTTSHSLILRQETISPLQNHTPPNHMGFTLRSPISTDLCRILGTSLSLSSYAWPCWCYPLRYIWLAKAVWWVAMYGRCSPLNWPSNVLRYSADSSALVWSLNERKTSLIKSLVIILSL